MSCPVGGGGQRTTSLTTSTKPSSHRTARTPPTWPVSRWRQTSVPARTSAPNTATSPAPPAEHILRRLAPSSALALPGAESAGASREGVAVVAAVAEGAPIEAEGKAGPRDRKVTGPTCARTKHVCGSEGSRRCSDTSPEESCGAVGPGAARLATTTHPAHHQAAFKALQRGDGAAGPRPHRGHAGELGAGQAPRRAHDQVPVPRAHQQTLFRL